MKIIKSRKGKKTKALIVGGILLMSLTSCSFHHKERIVINPDEVSVLPDSEKGIYIQNNTYFVYSHEEVYELIDMINNGEIKDENPSFMFLINQNITIDDYKAFGDALVNLDKQEITVEYLLDHSIENASIYAKLNSNTEVFNVCYSEIVDSQYVILDSIDIESDNEDVKVTIQSNSDNCNLYIGENIVTNTPFNTVIIDSEKEKSLDLKN